MKTPDKIWELSTALSKINIKLLEQAQEIIKIKEKLKDNETHLERQDYQT